MGYASSWVAVKNGALEPTVRSLRWNTVDTIDEAFDPGLYAAVLPSEWVIVLADGSEQSSLLKPAHARELSKNHDTLFFTCTDMTMTSELIAFRNGQESWALTYDGADITARGTLPKEVKVLLAAHTAQHVATKGEEGDLLYDALAESGRLLTTFRHDVTFGDGGLEIAVLELEH